jgi:hypothetical protein
MNMDRIDKLLDFVKKVFWAGVVAVVMYLGESSRDGGFIKDIWAAAKTASPMAAMFAILAWLDERRERRHVQEQLNERTVDFIQSANTAGNVIGKMAETLKTFREALLTLLPRRNGRN